MYATYALCNITKFWSYKMGKVPFRAAVPEKWSEKFEVKPSETKREIVCETVSVSLLCGRNKKRNGRHPTPDFVRL